MAGADDVAAYIIDKLGPLTGVKLEKLIFYSYAYHWAWENKPLFSERIEAWANGPVVRDVYRQHRLSWYIDTWPSGDISRLTQSEKSSIDAVLATYGDKSAAWLSELSHNEAPWREARGDVAPGSRSTNRISPESIRQYYGRRVQNG